MQPTLAEQEIIYPASTAPNAATLVAAVSCYSERYLAYLQKRAKALLSSKGIKFTEYDITDNDKLRDEIIRRSGRSGRTSVPQIFIGEHHVGGASDLFEVEERGELDWLLEQR